MPTYAVDDRFWNDFDRLTPLMQRRFLAARDQFVADLRAGVFRAGLRVKKLRGHRDTWELSFAPDGRATFEYAGPEIPGEPHVVWRRVGTHDIFSNP